MVHVICFVWLSAPSFAATCPSKAITRYIFFVWLKIFRFPILHLFHIPRLPGQLRAQVAKQAKLKLCKLIAIALHGPTIQWIWLTEFPLFVYTASPTASIDTNATLYGFKFNGLLCRCFWFFLTKNNIYLDLDLDTRAHNKMLNNKYEQFISFRFESTIKKKQKEKWKCVDIRSLVCPLPSLNVHNERIRWMVNGSQSSEKPTPQDFNPLSHRPQSMCTASTYNKHYLCVWGMGRHYTRRQDTAKIN